MKHTIIVLLLLLSLPCRLLALQVPQLTGRVNDQAQMLPPESNQRLERKLAAFERETSNQIAVLTVPTLQGDNIDQFSIHVAEAWKIGQKGRDNGILLIIAQAERKVRIEVGMGLQGALPDITAGQIIRDVMRPHLKSGNYDQGITAGVDSIIAATKGEFKGSGRPVRQHSTSKSQPSFIAMLLGVVVAVALFGAFSRYLGGGVGALGLPLISSLAFPGIGMITLLLLAILGLFAGMLVSMALSSYSGGGGYWGGGFGGWGGGFSGSGGSSGGDDSFSGGGGDFDGGGSSDDY